MTSFRRRLNVPLPASAQEQTTAPDKPGPESTPEASHLKPTFATLPPEIHLIISQQLTYPDALSLKHTNRYFYNLVDTGVRLKIAWLVERRTLHLECPNHGCDLGSDLRFCRGSVSLLMQRRREHIECESRPGLGCLVYGTDRCSHPPKLSARLRRWLRVQFTVDLRWVLLALIPLLVGWLFMTVF
ncbi:hypothetical protein QBC37DRAFT_422673 [Rhypophila decipiens]|uniref:F-box domain-containing protein n=1 Tax=Rhypophila decipiens TaxID=261697 RepID=A0AAN6Y6S7_9PEZI|nr:hypothetical protein QBC37DRAFT_422673 [Rhypophila decipiens]